MTVVVIRQSGGANIISLPKAIVHALDLRIGSKLELSLQDRHIVLTPKVERLTLEALLAESPKSCFSMTHEGKESLNVHSR